MIAPSSGKIKSTYAILAVRCASCSSVSHVDRRPVGQYLDGTTDVTRTLHFGTPSADQRRALTRVLQGHIAIDTAVFPNGTSGRSFVADGMVKALTKRTLNMQGTLCEPSISPS
jgi:hypothetical protein